MISEVNLSELVKFSSENICLVIKIYTHYHFPKYCRFLLNHPVSVPIYIIYNGYYFSAYFSGHQQTMHYLQF